MHELRIRNCHVLHIDPAAGCQIAENQDILIDGAQITAIQLSAVDGSEAPPQAHQTIDGRGMLAIPGLINTHAHAPMVIFRGLAEDVSIEKWFNEYMWPLESNLTPEDVYWGMKLALVEMIEGGVTTVADHYFFMDQAAEAVTEADAGGAGLGRLWRPRLRCAGRHGRLCRPLAWPGRRPHHHLDGAARPLYL
ncbi:MAG: amidohydrolase family protein [Caldilineaceae bacterium]